MDNSSTAPNPDQAAIKQQAGAWIVKIDRGHLSLHETKQLQQWLTRSDFHRSYLEKLARNWDAMAILQELAPLYPLKQQHHWLQQITTRLRGWLPQWPTQNSPVFASLAMVALAAVLWTFGSGSPDHYQTAVGQQASYQLPDGTQVVLNTNTALKIEYTPEQRVIRLQQGEAHFTVAKNPQRPFVVYAGDGMVWAVGTAFNVRYHHANPIAGQADTAQQGSQYIDVLVTEGTVKVYADSSLAALPSGQLALQTKEPSSEALVPAGQSVQYSKQIKAIAQESAQQQQRKLAWQQGSLIFKGETLEQALQEIARYTDQQLVIVDPAISDIRVGGHYKTNDIDALLVSLSESFGVQIKQISRQRLELSQAP